MPRPPRKPGVNYIYALSDPISRAVRYVGKSCNLDFRFQSHLRDTRSNPRTEWIAKLISQGNCPIVTILEVVPAGEPWAEAEKRWIATGLAAGWDLLNRSAGGEGAEAGACRKRRRNYNNEASRRGKHRRGGDLE